MDYTEKTINKKSCWFSKENIPLSNNSYDDFFNNYKLINSNEFDIFNCFVD